MDSRAVALSGEIGSGKSSVAERLAAALGARRVSFGEAQRQIAAQRGVTTLELNRMAEVDPTIDDEIDGAFRALASAAEPLVVDSRLAWHFLPDAYKVHLVVDPQVAAERILHRPGTHAEHYDTLAQAVSGMAGRVESERRRFLQVYGIDIFRLRNYDLVVDTTEASPDQVADRVLAGLAGAGVTIAVPALALAPTRVAGAGSTPGGNALGGGAPPDAGTPGTDVPDAGTPGAGTAGDAPDPLVEEIRREGFVHLPPVVVDYRRPTFSVVDGRRRVRAARRAGLSLIPAVLRHDGADGAAGGGAAGDSAAGHVADAGGA